MRINDKKIEVVLRPAINKFGLLILLAIFAGSISAQNLSNIRHKTYIVSGDTLQLDSLSIVPGSLTIQTKRGLQAIDSATYMLRPYESKLIWLKKPGSDTLVATYRTYPFKIGGETYHKSYAAYVRASANSVSHSYIYTPDESKEKLIDFGSLDYNGSFSRSISFGSNQDVSLNSLFNVQLSGMLTHDIEIKAAITDNNVPIQPEGNTQQLQQFDQVYIQIRKDQNRVTVGDFDLNGPNDYFLKFQRKYEGGMYSGAFKIKKIGLLKTTVAGGISRGQYASNTLAVTEGNQGPYNLIGANGETVITILANTEQVFIDGQKMDRGADRDYTIDYNLGTVTFTPKRIVTPDMRVVVEFQYSNNNYSRSFAYMNTELQTQKVNVHFNIYSEQDSKNQNIQQTLTSSQKGLMAGLGDSIQKAFYPGYDTATFNSGLILYALTDTTVFPFHFDSVFVYSTDSTKAKYQVNFSYVGQGQGNYNLSQSTANGRVYQWVVPYYDTAKHVFLPQGSYAPVILLVTPKLQQMYTVGADYHINKTNTLSVSGAMSNYDQNLYSTIDNDHNIGFATHVNYKGYTLTNNDSASKKSQAVTYDLSYDFTQSTFSQIEPYRNIEFNRDWNIATGGPTYNQHLINGNLGYTWQNLGFINYHFKALLEDTVYHGYENGIDGKFSKNGFTVTFTNSFLDADNHNVKSDFIRPKGDFVYSPKSFRGWKVGAGYDHEFNLFKVAHTDTFTSASYLWQNYRVYMASPDSSKNKYGVEFLMRYQQRPDSARGGFGKPYYEAQTLNFTGTLGAFKNQSLTYTLTYRHAWNADSASNSATPENFYLGRIDYTITALKGAIRSSTLYELGTGREQKEEVTYQASPTNTGDYIWIDFNHDGIKQINEFVASPYHTDTSYVRVVIPTTDYATVNTNQFNEVLNLNPAAVWKNQKGAKRVVSMFSALASIQMSKKTYASADKKVYEYFNPIPLNNQDTNLVSTVISSRNSLYFNRTDPKYGAQFDYNYSRSRTFLTGGFENHFTEAEDVMVRWNIVKPLNTQTTYTYGIKSDESDYDAGLQYRFRYHDANTDISYQLNSAYRLDVKYDFNYAVNPNDSVGNQTALTNKATLEGRYNRTKKSNITLSFSYALINYNDKGYTNQQLQYAMLNGLEGGNNLVWSATFSQTLLSNIQLTITYDGRITGFEAGNKSTLKPINTAKAELRALF